MIVRFLRQEWPTLLGIALGFVALAAASRRWIELPTGSDWGAYVRSADFVWHRSFGLHYTDWRLPLYPYLLGLGALAVGSYARAGVWLALGCVASLVVSAGIAARYLGGRWAVLPAAVGVSCFLVVGEATRWVNLYPLEAAMLGASFACGAATLRTGRVTLAALAGLFAGLCSITDPRGALAVPVAAVLVLGGVRRPAHGLALLLAFGLPVAAMVYGNQVIVAAWGIPQQELAKQLQQQGELAFAASPGPADEALALCLRGGSAPLTLEGLTSGCADVLRARNLDTLAAIRALPVTRWFLLALLLLVPRPREGRVWVASALAYGGLGTAVWMAMGLAEWPDRYILPYIVPLAVLAPVAVSRALGGARMSWGTALVALLLTVVGFAPPPRAVPDGERGRDRSALEALAWIGANVPSGDLIADCSDYSLDLVDLPAARHTLAFGLDIAAACSQLTFNAARPDWMVYAAERTPAMATAGYSLAFESGVGADRVSVWALDPALRASSAAP